MNNLTNLPEKWCIKPNSESQLTKIWEYCASQNGDARNSEYYYHFPEFKRMCTCASSPLKGFTEITFKQFERWVLKEIPNYENYEIY